MVCCQDQMHPGDDRSDFKPLQCGAMVCCAGLVEHRRQVATNFKPLQCGAMVCCCRTNSHRVRDWRFQTPSVRGNGLLKVWPDLAITQIVRVSNPFSAGQWFAAPAEQAGKVGDTLVSNPFSAGQWFAGRTEPGGRVDPRCFKPLQCGAMVCWSAPLMFCWYLSACFKPLQCGAMVCCGSRLSERF
mgnify:CR=1 FL=1